MMIAQLSPDDLARIVRPQSEPVDFDDFWKKTFIEFGQADLDVQITHHPTALSTVDVWDISFAGYNGERIRGWLRMPRERTAALPGLVEFVGYGGGRGHAEENLLWPSSGYAHLIMDNRGQPDSSTPDPSSGTPHAPGFMTLGILDPETYYYRRLFVDAARAVDAMATLDAVDSSRIGVLGASQGGGISIAAAALSDNVASAAVWVPFLCDFSRSAMYTETHPYAEIVRFLNTRRSDRETALATLAYFDGVFLAKRASAPVRFSVGLMDDVCPPQSVFAAFDNWAGPKDIDVWHFNAHEGGAFEDRLAGLRHFNSTLI